MSDRLLRSARKRKVAATESNQCNHFYGSGPSNRRRQSSPSSSTPEIFKLTADCCDEIFEYLSMIDLHSFGQTCKIFNKVAGEYFKTNFSARCFHIDGQGAFQMLPGYASTNIPGFNGYITKVVCLHPNAMNYLAKHAKQFPSIKDFDCSDTTLKRKRIIHKIMPQIEHISSNFYSNHLSMCQNLKSLKVQMFSSTESHEWLHQIFPNFVSLKCDSLPPIDDVINFFEKNPTIQSFSVGLRSLLENKDRFLNSTIKLDLLKVDQIYQNPLGAIKLLNELYERGFYKRLHLTMLGIHQHMNEMLPTLQGLEKISIQEIGFSGYCLPEVAELKRLDIRLFTYQSPNELERMANALVKLQRFSVTVRSVDDILPFIRRSVFLNKIQLGIGEGNRRLNLSMLNKERTKLDGARKVLIYVTDDVYLATKWAIRSGETNFHLIEMRRESSFEWDEI